MDEAKGNYPDNFIVDAFGTEKLYIQKLHTISIITKRKKKRKNVD